MNLQDYYLDIKKINKLKKQHDRETIHGYYRDMLFNAQDGRTILSQSLFNTLLENGYLISIRNEKIDKIVDGDKALNN